MCSLKIFLQSLNETVFSCLSCLTQYPGISGQLSVSPGCLPATSDSYRGQHIRGHGPIIAGLMVITWLN